MNRSYQIKHRNQQFITQKKMDKNPISNNSNSEDRNLFHTIDSTITATLKTNRKTHPYDIKHLQTFLLSDKFAILYTEFCLIQSITQSNQDDIDSMDSYNKIFAEITKNIFLSDSTINEDNLLNTLEEVFSNINNKYLNIDSVASALMNPYLEYSLIEVSKKIYYTDQETQILSILLRKLLARHDAFKQYKIHTYIDELLENQLPIVEQIKENLLERKSTQGTIQTSATIINESLKRVIKGIILYAVVYYIGVNEYNKDIVIPFLNVFMAILAIMILHTMAEMFYSNRKFRVSTEELKKQMRENNLHQFIREDIRFIDYFKDIKDSFDNHFKNIRSSQDLEKNILDIFRKSIIVPKIKLQVEYTDSSTTANILNRQVKTQNSLIEQPQKLSQSQQHPIQSTLIKKAKRHDIPRISSPITHQSSITKPVMESQSNNKRIIIKAGVVYGRYPSTDILYEDLIEVIGNHGNKYFIYWDKNLFKKSTKYPNLSRLKEIFLTGRKASSSTGHSGIKRLSPKIYIKEKRLLLSHEIKGPDASRVYGFVHSAKIGPVLILCYPDKSGKKTNH